MKKVIILLAMVVFAFSVNAQNTTKVSVEFQGSTHIGTIFDAYGGGPTLDIDAGAKFVNHLYVGIATGLHTYFAPYGYGQHYWIGYVPLGVNLKGYFTKDKLVSPYLNCSLGGLIAVSGRGGGFHCQVGAGIEVKRVSFGIGYNCMIIGGRGDSGYIKIGYTFGSKKK